MTEYIEPKTVYFEVRSTNFVNPSSLHIDNRRYNHDLETIMLLANVRRQGTLSIGKYVAKRNGDDIWAITPLPKPSSPSH